MSDVHLSHPSPDRLAAYPLGQLDAAEAAAVAAHLADCPACRAARDALPRDTLSSLARASTTSLHPGTTADTAAKPRGKATPPAPDDLPEQFGPYKITKLLGRGGMGSVYLAHDPRLDRPVALKVPQFTDADGPHVLERFYREARAAARIGHKGTGWRGVLVRYSKDFRGFMAGLVPQGLAERPPEGVRAV